MIRRYFFSAAGYGTRFLSVIRATPKEMLPILTKPLIPYGVEEAIEAGIHIMAIVTGRGKQMIISISLMNWSIRLKVHPKSRYFMRFVY